MGWKEELEAFIRDSAELVKQTRASMRSAPERIEQPSPPEPARFIPDSTLADELKLNASATTDEERARGGEVALLADLIFPDVVAPAQPASVLVGGPRLPQVTERNPLLQPSLAARATPEKSERELIANRVASFKAQQERLRQDREEYYARTIGRIRALGQSLAPIHVSRN